MQNFKDKEHFCILPFSHLYFFSDGNAYPCPMLAGRDKFKLGKSSDEIEKLWNSDVLKKMRIKMINNEKIIECHNKCNLNINSCKNHLGKEAIDKNIQAVLNTQQDGTTPLNFSIWNVYESNKCNFACTYCNGDYSNRHLNGLEIKNSFKNSNEMVSFYEKHIEVAQEVWFASGEPALLEGTYILLDKLLEKNKNVKLRFISNLSATEYKGRKIYELLKRFDNVTIFGSWDLDGEKGEYIRYGNSNEKTLKTIDHIHSLNLKFYLQPVISIFNIYYFYDFHKRMVSRGVLNKDSVRYYLLVGPDHYRFSILPNKIKTLITPVLDEYANWVGISNDYDIYPNREQPSTYIKKINHLMNTGEGGHLEYSKENNYRRLKEFFTITQNLDIKRYGYFKFMSLYSEMYPETWLDYDNYQ